MAQRIKKALVSIDMQNDFMGRKDGTPLSMPWGNGTYTASLPVAGAVEDVERLCDLIEKKGADYYLIIKTLDSHHALQIFHPKYWRDAQGRVPIVDLAQGKFPFPIFSKMIESGEWTPFNANVKYLGINPNDPQQPMNGRDWALYYTRQLEAGGRDPLMIWPEHCLIGEPGQMIYPRLARVLREWAVKYGRRVQFKVKGDNMFTECYGGLRAEVEIPRYRDTVMDLDLVKTLQQFDETDVAGEATLHCVKNTVEQIVSAVGTGYLGKLRLVTDAMSAVPLGDYEKQTADFISKMKGQGLQTATTAELMAA